MDWEKLLSLELYHFLFVFARLGGAFLFMPFYASVYIPNRVRLLFALTLAVMLTPVLSGQMPPPPGNVPELFRLLLIEITAGVFLGLFPFFIMTAIDLAGVNAAMATSFSNATLLDPQTNVQSTVLTGFLTLCALLVIVTTDLYQILLGSVLASYDLFPVGQSLLTGDMMRSLAKTLSAAFTYGFQIGSPFIIMIILIYSSMGVMSRLMPQLNIIFIVMPLQVYLGLALLMVSLPMIMWWFSDFFRNTILHFAL
ncbi:MAG: flagellar biosynthetic protein FliR [Alphaproteobacteria bacterium]|nr:flagellar biosynthetic protein FliR [Alphaproteobacteria bacterium]MBO4644686.1 flagellar biosynthetic protein FliR [Alphaproteobacteria bacterium]